MSGGKKNESKSGLPRTGKAERPRRPEKPDAAELAGSCGIAIMAKASAPGRTKTRLVPPLTFDQAADLNTAFLQDICGNLLLAAQHSPISPLVAYGPPGCDDFFARILPSPVGLIEAWLPNFGDCLYRSIERILASGHESAVVLNSDSPTLPTALLIETAEVLAPPGDRAVLGPSNDGGYYLLGLKRAHRRMFEDIAWSTERVAAQTLERARGIGLEVHVLPQWYDVDDAEGLRRLADEIRRGATAARRKDLRAPHYPSRTAALMRRIGLVRQLAGGGAPIRQVAAQRA